MTFPYILLVTLGTIALQVTRALVTIPYVKAMAISSCTIPIISYSKHLLTLGDK